jgi:GTPase
VGKSSLFNALSKHKIAIVADIAHTTRDMIEYDVETIDPAMLLGSGKKSKFRRRPKNAPPHHTRSYIITDSGGIAQDGADASIVSDVRERVLQYVRNRANIVLFLVEASHLTPADYEIASELRKSGKPVLVVVHKSDTVPARQQDFSDVYGLGWDVYIVSSLHRTGIEELRVAYEELLPPIAQEVETIKTHKSEAAY